MWTHVLWPIVWCCPFYLAWLTEKHKLNIETIKNGLKLVVKEWKLPEISGPWQGFFSTWGYCAINLFFRTYHTYGIVNCSLSAYILKKNTIYIQSKGMCKLFFKLYSISNKKYFPWITATNSSNLFLPTDLEFRQQSECKNSHLVVSFCLNLSTVSLTNRCIGDFVPWK